MLKNIQYYVGPISFPTPSLCGFPTWSRCRPDVVSNVEPLRHRPDVGPISFPTSNFCGCQTSARHRPDVVLISLTTSGRHRAHVQTWSRPDISRHLPISARYILRTSGRCRGRHLPISGRHRASVVFRYRPDIESISARFHPDIVDDIWPTSSPRANMESARYHPTFADIGPI